MEKLQKFLQVFWEPLALLAVGFVLMMIHFTGPSTDWIFNIVGSVLLLGAALAAMLAVARQL